ncbi:MAG TPA: adenylate/guanylate cyclase domain-containing protein, partial [Abditibacteriaceae bacterium]
LARPEQFRDVIKDSVCLIGLTSYDLQDYHSVPLATMQQGRRTNLMPGIEIHANIVHTLLGGKNIRGTPHLTTWLLILLAALVAAPLSWVPRVGLVVPTLFLLLGGWALLCLLAFRQYDVLLPAVAVGLTLLAVQTALTSARLWHEGRHKKWVEEAFGRYVSPSVLQHLQNAPDAMELGGKRQDVTVLFSDIRGFTQLSEHLEPEQVTRFLNNYLEKMVRIIFANGGTVDKFMGDGIMVIYNWPVEQPDHAMRALRSAVQMQREVEASASEWSALGMPPIHIGVGIHTGPAVLGNIGSSQRMEQTAIGDTINVASRIEGLCKTVGKEMNSGSLLSETTFRAAKAVQITEGGHSFSVLPAGETEVRGRREAMRLHAIVEEQAGTHVRPRAVGKGSLRHEG